MLGEVLAAGGAGKRDLQVVHECLGASRRMGGRPAGRPSARGGARLTRTRHFRVAGEAWGAGGSDMNCEPPPATPRIDMATGYGYTYVAPSLYQC